MVQQAGGAQGLVETFLQAIEMHDPEGARACLADEGFHYRSPISEFTDADSFIADMTYRTGIVQRMEIRKAFADGNDLCHILSVHIQISSRVRVDAVIWSRVLDGRIQWMEVLFDAYPYRALFPAGTEPPSWL
ncbi:nuclear transport factor 2 family protein [Methylonatrum kenyense]|uniref:nuclear transport factor 2 family protein n=1 Tax=Methylonatrum kenyense TaxID=455253 RepID=UPI0020BF1D64|nr:nuclear transport factor 2 family protein [Methylonatrum kenyense]MCK8516881.1 nuclear transport factor 2 family protein [Methylonatrum kenyense]